MIPALFVLGIAAGGTAATLAVNFAIAAFTKAGKKES